MKFFSSIALAALLAAPLASALAAPFEIILGSEEKNIGKYGDYNFNTAIVGNVNDLAAWDSVIANAIPADSKLAADLKKKRGDYARKAAQAAKLGLKICVMTDEVSLPIPLLQRLNANASVPGKQLVDFGSEQFWQVYRAKYREALSRHPEIAYVMIRTGENYSRAENGFAGRTVLNGKYDDEYFSLMSRLIAETRAVVVDEFHRTLIWRTWDLGNDGFHANPAVYDRVLAGVTNHTGLIFAVKHTQTDFWLYNDFNPMIGRGDAKQIVEFQCAREYEGKGAFPNYIGALMAADMARAQSLGAKGVWLWNFGGGWGGPKLGSDRWVRLNIEAGSRLAKDPSLSAQQIAEDWAAKEFGAKSAKNVAAMLALSSECIRKGMYIEAYARDHRGWKPSLNLLRDDVIRGEPLKQLFDGCAKALPEVFSEKKEAVALAKQMRELFEKSRADIIAERGQKTYDEAHGTLLHLESLVTVLDHYVCGMFQYYRWQETRDAALAAKAQAELAAWRAAWAQYQEKMPDTLGVAGIYRSQNRALNPTDSSPVKGAMADLCELALQELKTARTPGMAALENQSAAVKN